MTTEKYPIKKITVLDIMNVAIAINESFEMYLVPPSPGIYMKGRLKPSIIAGGGPYYQLITSDTPAGKTANRTQAPITFEDIDWIESTVYNTNGDIIIPQHAIHNLSNMPSVPVVAIYLVRDLVEEYIHRQQAWADDRTSHEYEVVRKYLRPEIVEKIDIENAVNRHEYQHRAMADLLEAQKKAKKKNRVVPDLPEAPDMLQSNDLIEDILSHMSRLTHDIQNFIGIDEWVFHYTRDLGNRAVQLIKSEDFRILDWTERMESGEWKA